MPVAKNLSYPRPRSQTERPRRIDGPSFAHLYIDRDETLRGRRQAASSSGRSAIAVASAASRLIFTTAVQFAESAGDILLAIASWVLKEILTACIAYAVATHGMPAAVLDEESGDPRRSAPPDPPRHRSRPALHVISANIRSGETLSEPTRGAPSGWRVAIVAPAVLLLSKIREGSARRRAMAELRSLDDRSLSDIGISRTDISYIARYGARRE